MFAVGFRDYLATTEVMAAAIPLTQLIRGKP